MSGPVEAEMDVQLVGFAHIDSLAGASGRLVLIDPTLLRLAKRPSH
jgi:hypothetical protein